MQLFNALSLILYLVFQMQILSGSKTAPGRVMTLWTLSLTSATQVKRDEDNCAAASLMSCWGEGL